MTKKLILSLSAVFLIAAVAVGATLAYFTADTPGTNVVSIGNVNISAQLSDVDAATTAVTPGVAFDVTGVVITNKGKNPAYIRVQLRPAGTSQTQYYTKLSLSGGNFVTSTDATGTWYHYKFKLEPGEKVEFNGLATLINGVKAADLSAGVNLQYHVEAIQTDRISTDSTGYPIWPGVEIKELKV